MTLVDRPGAHARHRPELLASAQGQVGVPQLAFGGQQHLEGVGFAGTTQSPTTP